MGWVIGFTSITQSPGGRSTADGRKGGRGSAGACAPRHSDLPGGLVREPAAGSREAFDPADQLPAQPARADVQDRLPVLPQRCAALRVRGPALVLGAPRIAVAVLAVDLVRLHVQAVR